ncbi:hypothetical protein K8375_09650 [Weissella cibaria]|uniref:hypothetical protein n=1 Tax=Weissella cibaria TaxID=137591 RepID=UPI001CC42EAB|nr:hypothetical protein [Weissella cibaria]MBZ6070314.1 hypothetical protein [Weissella cibaria]MCT0013016.1 hypothetical protein [Weissella cibaria]MCT0951710.1 hypothetical protein [Weissella cibaria]MCU7538996.1 hypothetical protein [Weissella cibaria]
MSTKLDKFDEIKEALETVGEIEFTYKNLIYFVMPNYDAPGKWVIYANKPATYGDPIFIDKNVSDPFTYDFGDGKTFKDIWKQIEPHF